MALPALDGRVLGDPAWTPLPANYMGGTNNIFFKMVRGLDSAGIDSVMIGLMVNRQSSLVPSSQLRVVFGFVFDESADPPPCAWRVHVQPFAAANPAQGTTLAAADVPYWRLAPPSTNNTLNWNSTEAAKHIAWLTGNAKVWSYNNPFGQWSMELKMPVNPVNCAGDQSLAFPAAGIPFRFYADILSSPDGAVASQYSWPAGLTIPGQIDQNTPPWLQWNYFSL